MKTQEQIQLLRQYIREHGGEHGEAFLHDLNMQIVKEQPALHKGASEAQKESLPTPARLTERRFKVLHHLWQNGARTCDSVEVALGMTHQSCSAVLSWAEKNSLAERDFSQKRTTRTGGKANPYRITADGALLLARRESQRKEWV